MAKDLIEINAEITAEKLKTEFLVKGLISHIDHTTATKTVMFGEFYKELKGK